MFRHCISPILECLSPNRADRQLRLRITSCTLSVTKKRPRIRIEGVLADGLTVRQSATAQWYSRQTSQPVAKPAKIQSPRGSRQEQTTQPAAKPEKVQSPKQDQTRQPSQPSSSAERVKRQDPPAKASPQASKSKTEKPKGKQPNQPEKPGQEEKSK